MSLLAHDNTSLHKCTSSVLDAPSNNPVDERKDVLNDDVSLTPLQASSADHSWINEVDNHILGFDALSQLDDPEVCEGFGSRIRRKGIHTAGENRLLIEELHDVLVFSIGKVGHQSCARVDDREMSWLTFWSLVLECRKKQCREKNGGEIVDLERNLMALRTKFELCHLYTSVEDDKINAIKRLALFRKVLNALVCVHIDLPDEDLGTGILGAEGCCGCFTLGDTSDADDETLEVHGEKLLCGAIAKTGVCASDDDGAL